MEKITEQQRSFIMSKIRSKNTKAELELARALWKKNIRYRKHSRSIFGTPDISIKKIKLAIFVDSEFFHGKDWETKKRPLTNAEFWVKKNLDEVVANIERHIVLKKSKVIEIYPDDDPPLLSVAEKNYSNN